MNNDDRKRRIRRMFDMIKAIESNNGIDGNDSDITDDMVDDLISKYGETIDNLQEILDGELEKLPVQ